MGKKKKTAQKLQKKRTKALKKGDASKLKELVSKGCKTKCCKKYQKCEAKRCGRCPCYDLLQQVA